MSDVVFCPVLTPSVVHFLPNAGTSAELATASGVITSAAATVATTPARSEAKALCPLVFIFILALEGLLLFTIL
jgi:tetrahydromethanopterin S-methyltransferase subunit D